MNLNWWSSSKGTWLPIGEMNLPHARNALAKLNRGEYVGADGNPPSAGEAKFLRDALDERIAALEADAMPPDPMDETPGS